MKMINKKTRSELIEERLKTIRSLEKELNELYGQIYSPTYVELVKPIRDGWFRTFRLRDDIMKRDDFELFLEIIELVSVKVWGSEKRFCDRNWNVQFKKLLYHYQRPGIRYINQKEYDHLSISAKKHFSPRRLKLQRWESKSYRCIVPKYYFVITYKRAYITRRKLMKPELDKRAREIENILHKSIYFDHSSQSGGRYHYNKSANKKWRRKTNMALSSFDIDELQRLRTRTLRD